MKLNNLKTKTEFFDFADIWYQRTISLVQIWQDKEAPAKRRTKALFLWHIMLKRMAKINQIALEISKPKKGFKSGGISGIEHGQEIIKTPTDRIINL